MTPTTINITAAERVGDYCLHLTFNDGTEQTVDFKPFLSLSHHPDIRAYLEPARFAAFSIKYGESVWGEYELCFPIIDLYRNQLSRNTTRELAA